MALEPLLNDMLPLIEAQLHHSVDDLSASVPEEPREMINYHMGWTGEGAGPEAQGKRIRPLMVTLCAAACCADWREALPAAAAVELVHNFSLIHDDIQDNSPLRRGRPTVWVRWGVPQAINAGDMLFTLAHLAIYELNPGVALEAVRVLDQTCLALTAGQYLDISYEQRSDLALADYWPMVQGKTAALLGCCAELGAITAGVNGARRAALRQFGVSLGLAFQAFDDWLGIWGDAALTGKSTGSDLISGKKSLPVLHALEHNAHFAKRWQQGAITAGEVQQLANWMAEGGSQEYTLKMAEAQTTRALDALHTALDGNQAAQALEELAGMLLRRKN